MAFNFNKCKLLCISYRKSSIIKYVYNMYQANALSDNNYPLLALLAKKHLDFTVPTADFIHIEETQHETYLVVVIDNQIKFYSAFKQTNNNNNIHTYINMNTERAGNDVMLAI